MFDGVLQIGYPENSVHDVTLKLEITLFVGLSEYLHLLLVHKIAIFLTKEDYFTYFVLKRLTTNL
jgi:hypothetical protein